jgi:hypothetical protein
VKGLYFSINYKGQVCWIQLSKLAVIFFSRLKVVHHLIPFWPSEFLLRNLLFWWFFAFILTWHFSFTVFNILSLFCILNVLAIIQHEADLVLGVLKFSYTCVNCKSIISFTLWHGRIKAEHVGAVRKKSFIQGRTITSFARWNEAPQWEK